MAEAPNFDRARTAKTAKTLRMVEELTPKIRKASRFMVKRARLTPDASTPLYVAGAVVAGRLLAFQSMIADGIARIVRPVMPGVCLMINVMALSGLPKAKYKK